MFNKNLKELWSDTKNWKNGNIYSCKEDPRIIVPKRNKSAGWTVNFAHKKSYWVIPSIFFVFISPVAIVMLIGNITAIGFIAAWLIGGALVVAYCTFLNPK